MKGLKTKKPAAPFAPLERDVEPNLRKLGFVRARCVSPSVPRVAREVGAPPVARFDSASEAMIPIPSVDLAVAAAASAASRRHPASSRPSLVAFASQTLGPAADIGERDEEDDRPERRARRGRRRARRLDSILFLARDAAR
eukprot:31392-Pelagococcus_subviridis.AAC.4